MVDAIGATFQERQTLYERYIEFMRDYLDAWHISLVNESEQE